MAFFTFSFYKSIASLPQFVNCSLKDARFSKFSPYFPHSAMTGIISFTIIKKLVAEVPSL